MGDGVLAAAEVGADVVRVRPRADAAEVESVGVSAHADRRRVLRLPVAVEPHRLAQLLEGRSIETGHRAVAPQLHSEVRRARRALRRCRRPRAGCHAGRRTTR